MEWVNEVAAWAWARHHNILSWYIRPLFLLPFCFFAYRRSLLGIGVTLVALATSMAWFPAPREPEPGGGRDAGRRAELPVRAVERRQGVRLAADPGHLHRARPGLLAPVVGLGAGGDQRGGAVQDRLDLRRQRHRRRQRAPGAGAGRAGHWSTRC